jgi:hypothetical protein
MRNDVSPYQPIIGTELRFSSISICQKWIPYEFDRVAMLANNDLRLPVLALVKFSRKKTSSEKKLKQLKSIIDRRAPNGVVLACVWRIWIVKSPPLSYHRKEFPDACSEYQCCRGILRDDDVINEYSELLRQDIESQWEQDGSRRMTRARMSVLLNTAEEMLL